MLPGERSIQIVGENALQNGLLCVYLRDAVGADCAWQPTVEGVLRHEEVETCEQLVLIDCFSLQREDVASLVESSSLGGLRGLRLTLFNLRPEMSIEQTAIRHGIRGFFYIGDSLASLVKGIQAVFNNEFWVSRKLLVDFLVTPSHPANLVTHYPGLTIRESELVTLLTRGLSNQGIANLLFISIPTVKSHLSSIYRKIKVTNRLQALCWAEKALLNPPPPEV